MNGAIPSSTGLMTERQSGSRESCNYGASDSASATGEFTTRVYHGDAGAMPDIADLWHACLAACPAEQQLFNFNWYDSWTRAYCAGAPWSGRSCSVVAFDPAGSPRAILPLVYRRAGGLNWLTHAGFYQPIRSFPCVPQSATAACSAIAAALVNDVKGWDALRLGSLDSTPPERAALLQAIDAVLRHHIEIPRGRTIVNRLRGSFDEYISSKTGKKFETYARRFAREPGARIQHFSNPAAAEAAGMYRDLQTVEQHSWLAEADGDLRFDSPADLAFWQRVTERSLTPGGHLDVWIAYIGEKPVAFRFVVSAGTTDYLIANQYDQAYHKLDIGWVLYLQHLKLAIQRGTQLIDMAPGDLHYKGRLGGEEADQRLDRIFFRNAFKGMVLTRAFGSLRKLKTWLSTGPGIARRIATSLPRFLSSMFAAAMGIEARDDSRDLIASLQTVAQFC